LERKKEPQVPCGTADRLRAHAHDPRMLTCYTETYISVLAIHLYRHEIVNVQLQSSTYTHTHAHTHAHTQINYSLLNLYQSRESLKLIKKIVPKPLF
jgi:hypothetical protein